MNFPVQMGRYTLIGPLGEGGDAKVYRAELRGPMGFTKEVAIKCFKRSTQVTQMERFIREGRLGGLLRHPNIIDVYEMGEVQGEVFIAMEFVDGSNLRDLIRGGSPIPLSCGFEICMAICRGLEAAHTHVVDGALSPVVHRDLKPANILIGRFGDVKVADFGIARISDGGRDDVVMGTLAYMAPEQLLREAVDCRTDIFSLGVTLYETVVGQRLFRGTQEGLIADRLSVDTALESSEIWDPVEAICPALLPVLRRCLRQYPQARISTALELRLELQGIYESLANRVALADWLRPEFIEAVAEEEETESFANLSTAPMRTNLRRPMDTFFGRADLIAQMVSAIGSNPVLVLVGLGGMGKTRAAIEVGWRALSCSPGGVWFCDLKEGRTKAGVLYAVANALGISLLRGSETDHVMRIGHVLAGRSSGLLILDNAEQVNQEVTELLDVWRGVSPNTTFLVTTRDRLALPGVRTFQVGQLESAEAMALFLERSARPLEPGTPGLESLVAKLDGMPLAIELAARRTGMFSPEQLHERLSERFRLLRKPGAWPSHRHGTLRAVLDSTWEGLSASQQDALAQCAVFRGGFFIEAAESIVDLSTHPDAPWVVDVLQDLIDKSLLTLRQVNGQSRLSLLVSVAEYAQEALGRWDVARVHALHKRHAVYFGQFGTQAYIDGLSSHHGIVKRQTLGAELDNLVAATTRAVENGWQEDALNNGLAAMETLNIAGPLASATALAQTLLVSAVGLSSHSRILMSSGWAFLQAGEHERAEALFQKAVEGAQAKGDQRLLGQARGRLGVLYRMLYRYEESAHQFEQAVQILESVGDKNELARVLGNFGNLYLVPLRPELAEHYLSRGLEYAIQCGNLRIQGTVGSSLGILRGQQGRLEDARRYFIAAIKNLDQIGDNVSSVIAQTNLARLAYMVGRREDAWRLYRDAHKTLNALGLLQNEGVVISQLGVMHLEEGRYDEAVTTLESALDVHRRGSDKRLELSTLLEISSAYYWAGRSSDAIEALVRLMEIAGECGDSNARTRAQITLVGFKAYDRTPGAREELDSVLAHLGESPSDQMKCLALGTLSLLHAQDGDFEGAERLLSDAEALCETVDNADAVSLRLMCNRCEVAYLAGDMDAAGQTLRAAEEGMDALGAWNQWLIPHLVARLRSLLGVTGS